MGKRDYLKSVCLGIFLISFSHSTIMFELGLQDLTIESEQIVQAKVTSIVTRWENNNTVINTYIRLNIVDDLIGQDEDNEIIIKTIGGTVGFETMSVSGMAEYKVGEENILFLIRDPNNAAAFQTLGLFQGKYRVFTDSNNVQRVTRDDTDEGITLYKKTGTSLQKESGNNYTLSDFKGRVLEYFNNK